MSQANMSVNDLMDARARALSGERRINADDALNRHALHGRDFPVVDADLFSDESPAVPLKLKVRVIKAAERETRTEIKPRRRRPKTMTVIKEQPAHDPSLLLQGGTQRPTRVKYGQFDI